MNQQIDTGDRVRHAPAQFDIPPNARWIAADDDGALYAFTGKPVCIDGKHWMSGGERSWHLGDIDMTGVDHRKTLVAVNKGRE